MQCSCQPERGKHDSSDPMRRWIPSLIYREVPVQPSETAMALQEAMKVASSCLFSQCLPAFPIVHFISNSGCCYSQHDSNMFCLIQVNGFCKFKCLLRVAVAVNSQRVELEFIGAELLFLCCTYTVPFL